MTAKKFYYVMLGVFAVGVLAIGATVYIGNNLLKKSSDKLVNVKLDSRVSEEQERLYLQAKKDLAKYEDLGATITKVLPKDKDQARAVLELYRIGDETGISIESIRFPASTLGTKAPAPAAAANTNSNESATPAPAKPTLTQAKAVEGISGVLAIDIDLDLQPKRGNSISYDQMLNFLNKVQNNRRNMQISKVSVVPDVSRGGLSFNISLRIFVKP